MHDKINKESEKMHNKINNKVHNKINKKVHNNNQQTKQYGLLTVNETILTKLLTFQVLVWP